MNNPIIANEIADSGQIGDFRDFDPNEPVKRTYLLTAGIEKELKDLAQVLADRGIPISDSAIIRMALQKGLPAVRDQLTK